MGLELSKRLAGREKWKYEISEGQIKQQLSMNGKWIFFVSPGSPMLTSRRPGHDHNEDDGDS